MDIPTLVIMFLTVEILIGLFSSAIFMLVLPIFLILVVLAVIVILGFSAIFSAIFRM